MGHMLPPMAMAGEEAAVLAVVVGMAAAGVEAEVVVAVARAVEEAEAAAREGAAVADAGTPPCRGCWLVRVAPLP